MITLLDFEKMVTEGAIVSFKRRHYVIKLRRQIKVEKLKFEKTEERKKSFHIIFEKEFFKFLTYIIVIVF